jgi:catechol 2,3-dioxygenase-like lactoylglutathione lyase family enzyme
MHLAFSIDPDEITRWEKKLADHAVAVESRVRWSRGGSSLYFRDPDNHSIELAAPGTWSIY